MKKIANKVEITGQVVDSTLEEKVTNNGAECISGELIVRTVDGSEHKLNYYSNKYKKNTDGSFSDVESKLYNTYKSFIDTVVTIKNADIENGDTPTVVRITDGQFAINDYKEKETGDAKSYIKVYSKFINTVDRNKLDGISNEALFEVEGIIDDITDEMVNGEPTGNLSVKISIIGQRSKGFGKDAIYEAYEIIPITLSVDKSMADGFKSAYYVGCFTKLGGKILNKTESKTEVEHHAFGEDTTKVATSYVRKYAITFGNDANDVNSIDGLSDDVIEQLRQKRKVKIAEIKNGSASTSNATFNPFAR